MYHQSENQLGQPKKSNLLIPNLIIRSLFKTNTHSLQIHQHMHIYKTIYMHNKIQRTNKKRVLNILQFNENMTTATRNNIQGSN